MISYCANIVLNNPDITRRGKARGFLTALFMINHFVGDDAEIIIEALKMDLSDPNNRILFRDIVNQCFDNYVSSYNVPSRAVVPLNIHIFE